MKKLIIYALILCINATVLAIAPPKNKDVKIPPDMLENIKNNPAYYMPGKGLTGQVMRFKEQKAAFTKQKNTTASYYRPYLQASIPVLCVQYSDVEAEWEIPTMQQKLFGEWPTGTMTDYYNEVSYGQFYATGQVYGWYQATGNSQYYFRDNNHTGELLRDLFMAADDSVDFGLYDNDGPDGLPNSGDDDGFVDVIAVFREPV